MGTSRLNPRERVEQSQLAAALAASRQIEPTPQPVPLPPPTATRYGDLGSGTLLTTTTETTTTSASRSAQRKSSDDRSGLLSSLNGDSDSIQKSSERGPTTPRMLSSSSTRPSARAPKRTLIDDDAADLPPPLAAPLNGAAQASGLESALKTNVPVANDTIMADETAEVIGDSDEESRRELTISTDLFRAARSRPARLTLLAPHHAASSYILSDVSQLPPQSQSSERAWRPHRLSIRQLPLPFPVRANRPRRAALRTRSP